MKLSIAGRFTDALAEMVTNDKLKSMMEKRIVEGHAARICVGG